MSKILVMIKWLFVFWLMANILIFCMQRLLIYVPDKSRPILSNADKKRVQVLNWKSVDHVSLYGFYIPALKHHQTLVFFHGNAGNIGTRKSLMYKLARHGYGVFMPEYRGYGGNSGRPSEKGLYKDARSAMNFLLSQGIKADDMVIIGESLGSGVALQMAIEYPISALILQSPFESLSVMARLNYPWVIFPVLDKYDNMKKIQLIKIPILIMHGNQDELVPYHQGLKLFYHARQSMNRQFKSFPNQGHALLWDDEYLQTIEHFLRH